MADWWPCAARQSTQRQTQAVCVCAERGRDTSRPATGRVPALAGRGSSFQYCRRHCRSGASPVRTGGEAPLGPQCPGPHPQLRIPSSQAAHPHRRTGRLGPSPIPSAAPGHVDAGVSHPRPPSTRSPSTPRGSTPPPSLRLPSSLCPPIPSHTRPGTAPHAGPAPGGGRRGRGGGMGRLGKIDSTKVGESGSGFLALDIPNDNPVGTSGRTEHDEDHGNVLISFSVGRHARPSDPGTTNSLDCGRQLSCAACAESQVHGEDQEARHIDAAGQRRGLFQAVRDHRPDGALRVGEGAANTSPAAWANFCVCDT